MTGRALQACLVCCFRVGGQTATHPRPHPRPHPLPRRPLPRPVPRSTRVVHGSRGAATTLPHRYDQQYPLRLHLHTRCCPNLSLSPSPRYRASPGLGHSASTSAIAQTTTTTAIAAATPTAVPATHLRARARARVSRRRRRRAPPRFVDMSRPIDTSRRVGAAVAALCPVPCPVPWLPYNYRRHFMRYPHPSSRHHFTTP